MNAKTSVFIATSLDGFIARSDGSIDWLNQANTAVPAGEDFGYESFINTVDVMVMGRNSFEQVSTFDRWPYEDKRVVVLSRTGVAIPDVLSTTVSTSSESPASLVQRLTAEGAQHLYIDGGQTIQSFLRAGSIDELTITVIPILLGTGKPLFGSLESDLELQHISTLVYDFGFVQNTYRLMKQG